MDTILIHDGYPAPRRVSILNEQRHADKPKGMTDRKEIGAAMARCRTAATPKRSQAWVAERLGVSATTVSMWETGQNWPPIEMLARYLELVGGSVSVDIREAGAPRLEEVEAAFGQIDAGRASLLLRAARVVSLIPERILRGAVESWEEWAASVRTEHQARR
jgi:transcriptional regulator with XRE-family HTH domain